MNLSLIIFLIVCNIFLINIITDIVLKEDLEKETIVKNDDWELTKVSILTIIILLIFQLKLNFLGFFLIFLTLIINSLIVSLFNTENLIKIKNWSNGLSKKIIKIWVKLFPIYILILIILYGLKFF